MGEVFPKYKCRKFKVRSLILSCKNFQLNNPTHAGKSIRTFFLSTTNSVQPHACGEKAPSGTIIKNAYGSTPRMWGKEILFYFIDCHYRFNPTHVGKREWRRFNQCFISVQPHACGEKVGVWDRTEKGLGSTPRMWGKDCNISSRV